MIKVLRKKKTIAIILISFIIITMKLYSCLIYKKWQLYLLKLQPSQKGKTSAFRKMQSRVHQALNNNRDTDLVLLLLNFGHVCVCVCACSSLIKSEAESLPGDSSFILLQSSSKDQVTRQALCFSFNLLQVFTICPTFIYINK